MVVEVKASSIYGTELKNLMEQFIQQHIKDRIECVLMMTIFLVEEEKRVIIDRIFGTDCKIFCTVLAYGNGQDTVY